MVARTSTRTAALELSQAAEQDNAGTKEPDTIIFLQGYSAASEFYGFDCVYNAFLKKTASAHMGTDISSERVVGLSILAGLPALFWPALANWLLEANGFDVAAADLVLFGASIAMFLLAVCAPLTSKSI